VRPEVVAIVAPERQRAAGVCQCVEDFLIQATKGANFLVNPDQRQPFPRRLARIGLKKSLNMLSPRPDLRQRLVFALIGEVGLARPQYLA
jgi:hypothetical protein